MELKTQALERILEALSPTLEKELELVAKDTQRELEQEFQIRLQEALHEMQETLRREAEAGLERSLIETREFTRKQVIEELEQEFQKTLEDKVKNLELEWVAQRNQLESESVAQRNQLESERVAQRNQLESERVAQRSQSESEWATERKRLEEQLGLWRVFADAQRQLGDASTQAEILARFMRLSEPFAASLAVYVTKADGLALWKNRGDAAFPEIISEGTTDPETYFRSILVRGKTVAAVCATPPSRTDIVDFLVSSVERALEVFGLKLKTPVPKLAEPEQADSAHDQKSHTDARRTARLLISEIKLYNEEELKAGRENNDIYRRLQKEIDHGREAYTQRVPSRVLSSRDYFHEELIRILGENEPVRMGVTYPGPNVQ